MAVAGITNLFIDGQLVIDLVTNPTHGQSFFGYGTADVLNTVKGLKGRQSYDMEIRLSNAAFASQSIPTTCRGGIRCGGVRQVGEEDAIRHAAAESKRVTVELGRDAISFYDDRQMVWVAEKGSFEVVVAASAADAKLKGEVILEKGFTWTGL